MNEYELVVILENLKKKDIDFNIDIYDMSDINCKNLYILLSSFSNAKGGYVIFGVDCNTYDVIGITDYEELKKKILEMCMQMVPIVTPQFELFSISNKKILALNIPELDSKLKPCYHVKSSNFAGAYIRKGHNNIELNQLDIHLMKKAYGTSNDEIRTYPNIDYHELDEFLVTSYINKIKKINPEAVSLQYEDILNLCKITEDYAPTLIGLLMFAKDPTKFFPNFYIEVCHINENGETANTTDFKGRLLDILDSTLSYVHKEINHHGISEEIVKECILNCLVHRDYSAYSEKTPITISLYSDKLTFKNPGGLYKNIKVSELETKSLESPNPTLKNLINTFLENEKKHDIKVITSTMLSNGFRPPEFINKNGAFTTILYYSKEKLDDKIINFCKEPKDIDEIKKYLKVETRHYTMSAFLQPLINSGKLNLTIPEFPTSKFQKYTSNIN